MYMYCNVLFIPVLGNSSIFWKKNIHGNVFFYNI